MCEFDSGYTAPCDAPAGVKTVYGANLADIDTLTVVAGNVTVLTMLAGKYVYAFNVEMETASFTDVSLGVRANKSYARQQDATVVLHGNTSAMIVNIENISQGRTVWFHELVDGTCEALFIENGAHTIDNRASGVAYEDMNGNTLTMTGKEPNKAPKIALSLISAVLAPAS